MKYVRRFNTLVQIMLLWKTARWKNYAKWAAAEITFVAQKSPRKCLKDRHPSANSNIPKLLLNSVIQDKCDRILRFLTVSVIELIFVDSQVCSVTLSNTPVQTFLRNKNVQRNESSKFTKFSCEQRLGGKGPPSRWSTQHAESAWKIVTVVTLQPMQTLMIAK